MWRAAKAPRRGYLCIGCLERRLGRELVLADFTDVPVNRLGPGPDGAYYEWHYRSARLRNRLTPYGSQLALPMSLR